MISSMLGIFFGNLTSITLVGVGVKDNSWRKSFALGFSVATLATVFAILITFFIQ